MSECTRRILVSFFNMLKCVFLDNEYIYTYEPKCISGERAVYVHVDVEL
jgi:hypothetical protein